MPGSTPPGKTPGIPTPVKQKKKDAAILPSMTFSDWGIIDSSNALGRRILLLVLDVNLMVSADGSTKLILEAKQDQPWFG